MNQIDAFAPQDDLELASRVSDGGNNVDFPRQNLADISVIPIDGLPGPEIMQMISRLQALPTPIRANGLVENWPNHPDYNFVRQMDNQWFGENKDNPDQAGRIVALTYVKGKGMLLQYNVGLKEKTLDIPSKDPRVRLMVNHKQYSVQAVAGSILNDAPYKPERAIVYFFLPGDFSNSRFEYLYYVLRGEWNADGYKIIDEGQRSGETLKERSPLSREGLQAAAIAIVGIAVVAIALLRDRYIGANFDSNTCQQIVDNALREGGEKVDPLLDTVRRCNEMGFNVNRKIREALKDQQQTQKQ